MNTDWMTAGSILAALVFVVMVLSFDTWRAIHGHFFSSARPHESLFWRIWNTAFAALGCFICVNLALKDEDRVVRFAFGFLGLNIAIVIALRWLVGQSAIAETLVVARALTNLLGFVLLGIGAVRWFRRKIVHV